MKRRHIGALLPALVVLALLDGFGATLLSQTITPPTATDSDRRLPAIRATGRIVLDGILDEPTWREAPVATGFIQAEPREREPATEQTEVRVLYDDRSLYIGVFAHESEPHRIIVHELKKDFTPETGDSFEFVLDTFRDGRNGYMFAINPGGAKWDAQMVNEGRETNVNWDGVWTARTRIGEEGWYAEIEIPFSTLKFSSTSPQTWGINFLRRVRRKNEDSFWSPLPRIYRLPRVSMAGTLDGLNGVRPGKNLRIKPYGLASMDEATNRPRSGDGDAGFDVKYGISSGLTWDFTVNTDFSQVEADEQQINLSRFSLFFPEKRDFFLENSGVFQFGTAERAAGQGGGGGGRQNDAARNDVTVFFSRQIGLSPDGDAIPILAGTRLTGRAGAYSIGALNIQQRAGAGIPATNFTALRLRRNVLGNSDVGVIALNKENDGSGFNRVFGADANLRFFQKLDLSALITKTSSPSAAVPPGTGHDQMYRSSFSYRGDFWEFRGSYASIGDRFNDEMGYVPRVGIDKTTAFASGHARPAKLSRWLRETWPHWEFSNVARHDGSLESRYYDYHVPFTFQNSSFVEVGLNRSVEELITPFPINPRRRISIPVGHYEFNDSFVAFRTDASAPFSINGRYGLGDFYDGYKRTYQIGFGTRFNERLNVSGSYTRNDIDLTAGAYATTLFAGRVNYSFTRSMFLNALMQYNSDARQWTSNVRFNLIHRPLSDFFVVYNDRRDSDTGDLASRTVIAKITYMVGF